MSPAHISTIEEEYEYRINRIIKRVLREYDHSVPENGEELMEFLWLHVDEFGKRVIDDMCEWKSEDEWLEELDE